MTKSKRKNEHLQTWNIFDGQRFQGTYERIERIEVEESQDSMDSD